MLSMRNTFQHSLGAILMLALVLASVAPAAAQCVAGSPVVSTDKPDYGPLDTVVISGSGFACGQVLSVLVTAPDNTTLSGNGAGSAGPDSVTTDGNGAFVLSYSLFGTLPGGGGYVGQLGTYLVQVANSSGTALASTTFDPVASYHSCALTTSGGVKCWGGNNFGQLGNGTTTNSSTPVDVSGLTSGVAQISSATSQTCAVTTAGGAECWGLNGSGQLGNGATTSSTTPVDVSGLTSGVAQIRTALRHTCAVTTAGGAKCWGNGTQGQLGNGANTPSTTPVDVSGLTSGVAQISVGALYTCAVTTSGGAKCWGFNINGQLGNGSTTNSNTPVDVSGLTSGVAQIGGMVAHTCGLTTAGGVKCWGYGLDGELGNGATISSATPVDVSGLTSGVAKLWDGGPVVIDTIPPTAAPTQSPAANGAGWNNTDVTVTWNWTDNMGGSGIDSANCTTSSVSSGEGAAIMLSATCKDLAGNTGTASYMVKVDKTAPAITVSATKADTTAYTFGTWTNQTVTVHYACSDALSGVATCSSDQVFSADGNTSTSGTATDNAGNSASTSSVLVAIDKTPPAITAIATKADTTAYIAGTWTNQTVTVHFTCSDAGSGIATCPANQVLSVDGVTASVSGTATDNAGNSASASFGPVEVDKTKPTLNPAVSPNPVLLNGVAVATSGAADALSGLASQSCGPVVTTSAGTNSVMCTATDNAGNTNSAIVNYVVVYSFSGFLAPVNNVPVVNTGKSGRTYPVKWQLRDGNSAYIGALTAVKSIRYSSNSCGAFGSDPTNPLETIATGGTSLRYDSTANQYIYNWATPGAGCYTLFLTLDSGQVFPAYFNLK